MTILNRTRAVMAGLATAGLAAAGVGLAAAPAQAASGSTWDALAQCESSGNWSIDTGNGYYGGLQFTLDTWHGYGGTGNPANAGRATQIAVAERVLAGQGWGAWPACSAKLGLSGKEGAAPSPAPAAATTSSSTRSAPVRTSGGDYTVRAGDTLAKIAQAKGVSGGWQRIAAVNPSIADPNLIFTGQSIDLPG